LTKKNQNNQKELSQWKLKLKVLKNHQRQLLI